MQMNSIVSKAFEARGRVAAACGPEIPFHRESRLKLPLSRPRKWAQLGTSSGGLARHVIRYRPSSRLTLVTSTSCMSFRSAGRRSAFGAAHPHMERRTLLVRGADLTPVQMPAQKIIAGAPYFWWKVVSRVGVLHYDRIGPGENTREDGEG